MTWYSPLSHLSCILCLPFQAVFLTRTRSPMSSAAPLHLLSYSPLCLVCCLLATFLACLWANLSLLLSWVIYVDLQRRCVGSPLQSKLHIYGKPGLPTKQEVIGAIASGCILGAIVGMHHGWNIGFPILLLFRD